MLDDVQNVCYESEDGCCQLYSGTIDHDSKLETIGVAIMREESTRPRSARGLEHEE